jgi:hemoglobin-like flavoprotein
MTYEPRAHPGADMEGFVRELVAFVGLDEADVAVIRRTAPIILQHERALTSALYEHFLHFPYTARFFLKADGSPDEQRLERRKHSLGRWLRETAEVAMTHEFVYYLLAVSLSHSHRSYGPGGSIPPQFMVGAMSLAQTAFARLLQDEMDDLAQAFEAAMAWNKLLLLHLNVLLLGYFLPAPPAS